MTSLDLELKCVEPNEQDALLLLALQRLFGGPIAMPAHEVVDILRVYLAEVPMGEEPEQVRQWLFHWDIEHGPQCDGCRRGQHGRCFELGAGLWCQCPCETVPEPDLRPTDPGGAPVVELARTETECGCTSCSCEGEGTCSFCLSITVRVLVRTGRVVGLADVRRWSVHQRDQAECWAMSVLGEDGIDAPEEPAHVRALPRVAEPA